MDQSTNGLVWLIFFNAATTSMAFPFTGDWTAPSFQMNPGFPVPNVDFINVSGTSWGTNIPVEPETKEVPTSPKKSESNLYKTELCRSFEDTGICRYGPKCQFAHGAPELRPIARHPKYKTEICKTFFSSGACPYGKRCRFIHSMTTPQTFQTPLNPKIPAAQPVPTNYSSNWLSTFSNNHNKPMEPFTLVPQTPQSQNEFQLITPSLDPMDFGNTKRYSFFESLGQQMP